MELETSRARTRASITDVAARLLRDAGAQAVTTRAVAAEAGVQAPTLYRLFGDKDGLLEAVAEREFAAYVAGKARRTETEDPVADLRAGWDLHVGFGLANPALYTLLSDPRRAADSRAAAAGAEILRAKVRRVAGAGRLRVAEHRAAALIHAAGTGVVLTLLAVPAERRDPGLADAAWDAVLHAVTTDPPPIPARTATTAAVALRAELPALDALSAAERTLMSEWLDRIIGSGRG